MEKLLVIMDSSEININTIRFAAYLTKLTHSKLTGIFLDNPEPAEVQEVIMSETTDSSGMVLESVVISKTSDDGSGEKMKEENIRIFRDVAEQEGVQVVVEPVDISTPEIIKKTRFADILVIDAKTQFYGIDQGGISRFVKEALQDAECPVIIAPEDFESIDNIVFCYNGIKSSVFAIKQFMYLFPQLTYKRTKVINLNLETEHSAADEKEFGDWLKYHFKDVEFLSMNDEAVPAFFNYLVKKRNDFVVMGAYGKGLLASFFGNDGNEDTGRTASLPLFISHY
jgi:nucleotide-binding universal stress UspA family protein